MLTKMQKDLLAQEWQEWSGMRRFCLDQAESACKDYSTDAAQEWVSRATCYTRDIGMVARCYARLMGIDANAANEALEARAAKLNL